MRATEQIRCACGGLLHRPLPRQCPHCKRPIVRVRRKWCSTTLRLLAIAILFVGLVGYLVWITRR